MSCKSCGSAEVTTFVAEVNIHFSPSPPKNLDKPGVLVFPTLTICLDCGYTHCTLLERDLLRLREGRAA